MQLDDIRSRVDELKRAQENGARNVAVMELLLLWDFVRNIADLQIEKQSDIAKYILSSGIKSVDRRDLMGDPYWRKPFGSIDEFRDALANGSAVPNSV